jgi:hypothetical protein
MVGCPHFVGWLAFAARSPLRKLQSLLFSPAFDLLAGAKDLLIEAKLLSAAHARVRANLGPHPVDFGLRQ